MPKGRILKRHIQRHHRSKTVVDEGKDTVFIKVKNTKINHIARKDIDQSILAQNIAVCNALFVTELQSLNRGQQRVRLNLGDCSLQEAAPREM